VPEPASLVFMLVAALAWAAGRRLRS
jgi:hypothetical protein